MADKKPVVIQYWEESERGQGIRPDGYSLHLTEADRLQFIKEYWAGMPDEIQDEYSRPKGNPTVIDIDEELYSKVSTSKNGVRRYEPL